MVSAVRLEIIKRLGLRRLPGRAEMYKCPKGQVVWVLYSRLHEGPATGSGHGWFGINPSLLRSSSFVVFVCGKPEYSIVMPVKGKKHCGVEFGGLSDLLYRGLTVCDGAWRVHIVVDRGRAGVVDVIPSGFVLKGAGWHENVDRYWCRFDLITGEQLFLHPTEREGLSPDDTCDFCGSCLCSPDVAPPHYIKESRPCEVDAQDHEILGLACGACAWSDSSTWRQLLQQRVDGLLRDVRWTEKMIQALANDS